MSLLNRDRYRKKLRELLSWADDEAFFQLIWAVDALQSDRANVISRYLSFPQEAATSDMASKSAIHKWELETLIGQLLITPKVKLREGLNRLTNCSGFATAAAAVNLLRKLENAEAGIYLKRFDIFGEMHRIAQRTFPWQRGYLNVSQFYRYAYIYGQGECAEYFNRSYGLTTNEFSLIGFAFFSHFQMHPQAPRKISLQTLGVEPEKVEAALKLLSIPIAQARSEAVKVIYGNRRSRASLPVAFQPSLLRLFPLVSWASGSRLRGPLAQLIILRTTSGVFYDLIKGGSHLRNEASDRFEDYCAKYISTMMTRFEVGRSHSYRFEGNPYRTPDVLITDNGKVVVAVECKATRLAFEGQFAEDPVREAKAAYGEIAKGVFQLWRYFSHLRRGAFGPATLSPRVEGIVLTLDTWLVMSRNLQEKILEAATSLADSDPKITAEDRRKIVFCTIEDLENALASSNEDAFLRAITASVSEDRFAGWMLPDIHRECRGTMIETKPFPFELGDILPWWRAVEDRAFNAITSG